MKSEIRIFISSILKIITISSILSFTAYSYRYNIKDFVFVFSLVTISQFLINHFVNMHIERKNTRAEFLAQQVLKEASERTLPYDLNCAYCSDINRVGISFQRENIFKCNKCEHLNKVYIQFSTSRITEPITSVSIDRGEIELDGDSNDILQTPVNETMRME